MRMWALCSGGPWWWLADHSCHLQELGSGGRQSPGRSAAQSPQLKHILGYSCPLPQFSRSLVYKGACLEMGNVGQGNAGAQIRHFFPGLQQTLGCLPVPTTGLCKCIYSSLSVAKIPSLPCSNICKISPLFRRMAANLLHNKTRRTPPGDA